MILRYSEAGVSVAASGGGVTIKGVRPPWAVQLMPLVSELGAGEGRQAWQAGPYHHHLDLHRPVVGSPAGRRTLGGTDSGCGNLLFMMDGGTSIRSHRIWTVRALPRCPEGTAAGVRHAQSICYETETGNTKGHQQVHIMMSVEVLSFYLLISNSFCFKYFLVITAWNPSCWDQI